MEKTYWVQVEGVPDEAALQALRAGVQLRDGLTLPARARLLVPPIASATGEELGPRKRLFS